MKRKKIKCKHCHIYFYPSPYNQHHQKYCDNNDCRKASRKASKAKYRKKKSKEKEYREKESTRVIKWQRQNPGYWKNKKKNHKKINKEEALRDFVQVENIYSYVSALRDFAIWQHTVMQGLISKLTGDVLQDNIGAQYNHLYDIGQRVSSISAEAEIIDLIQKTGGVNEVQTSNCPQQKANYT